MFIALLTSQKVETIEMFINRSIDKQNGVQLYNGTLFSHKKE